MKLRDTLIIYATNTDPRNMGSGMPTSYTSGTIDEDEDDLDLDAGGPGSGRHKGFRTSKKRKSNFDFTEALIRQEDQRREDRSAKKAAQAHSKAGKTLVKVAQSFGYKNSKEEGYRGEGISEYLHPKGHQLLISRKTNEWDHTTPRNKNSYGEGPDSLQKHLSKLHKTIKAGRHKRKS